MLPKIMSSSRRNSPYVYPTIKLRCYRGSEDGKSMKSHTKAGHSCMRNIISFFRLPGRKTLKKVGVASDACCKLTQHLGMLSVDLLRGLPSNRAYSLCALSRGADAVGTSRRCMLAMRFRPIVISDTLLHHNPPHPQQIVLACRIGDRPRYPLRSRPNCA